MSKTEKSAESIGIIGGSDGPTAVFFGEKKKRTIKQNIRKYSYEQRKKRMVRRIKPGTHTLDEVVSMLCDRYGFREISKDDAMYIEAYDNMRFSALMQHAPKLLGEFASPPELKSRDEEGFRELQTQWEIRQQKAKEIPEEEFSIDLHLLEKREDEVEMHFEIETRFGHIGGGFSGPGKGESRKYEKLFREVYIYYGVTEEDIAGNTKRYQELVRVLAMRH